MNGPSRSDGGQASGAALDRVLGYHERTKHHLQRHARSPGFMDWSRQPDPFRGFSGVERIGLERIPTSAEPRYDALFKRMGIAPRGCERPAVSQLFYDSLALSAWKEFGRSRWSLRVNPSSGNLHPTEGYLLAGAVQGLGESPSVYHYAPLHHALELRARIPTEIWTALTGGLHPDLLLVGLTTIHWRESWKYGERAFRYCHLDLGHALAALAVAAACLGWRTRMDCRWSDMELAALLGVDTQSGPEAEHPDCLVGIAPGEIELEAAMGARPGNLDSAMERLGAMHWTGRPNRLSPSHHSWPVIDDVADASASRSAPVLPVGERSAMFAAPAEERVRDIPAREILRRRRSAVAMDGSTGLDRDAFFRILARTMPDGCGPPFELLPWKPAVHLVLFVHRVEGLDPGLYLLTRSHDAEGSLRDGMRETFDWTEVDGCPEALPLWRLQSGDLRQLSADLSCEQAIASDGAFAAAMIAEFEPTLRAYGAWFYRRLHWEAGAIGQILYLEAEAAGLRGTGIGCYFDDAVHDLLGIKGRIFQDLYHFTVGGAVEDPRLRTTAAYGPREI